MNGRGQTCGPIPFVPLLLVAIVGFMVLDSYRHSVAEARAAGRTFETTCGFGCGYSSQELAVATAGIIAAGVIVALVIHGMRPPDDDHCEVG